MSRKSTEAMYFLNMDNRVIESAIKNLSEKLKEKLQSSDTEYFTIASSAYNRGKYINLFLEADIDLVSMEFVTVKQATFYYRLGRVEYKYDALQRVVDRVSEALLDIIASYKEEVL